MTVIDRRKDSKTKSIENRRRYLDKHKKLLKEAVKDMVSEKPLKNLDDDVTITIPDPVGTEEPTFTYNARRDRRRVVQGDKQVGEGDDVMIFDNSEEESGTSGEDYIGEASVTISREELCNLIFDDCDLPDPIKKALLGNEHPEYKKVGFSKQGPANQLDLIESVKNAEMRKIARKASIDKEIKELIAERDSQPYPQCYVESINTKIEALEKEKENLLFLDECDLRYDHRELVPTPIWQAVVFFVMDVSGSVDLSQRDIIKRFFFLLYLFLTTKYETVSLVFIRHTEGAEEIDEHKFFNNTLYGGTKFLPAFELVNKIGEARYPLNKWNYYLVQASDGGLYSEEIDQTFDYLGTLIDKVQYYVYLEVGAGTSQYYELMCELMCVLNNVGTAHVQEFSDVYPAFRKLFEK